MEAPSTKSGPAGRSVAVVMATFNRAHLISESIDSLLNQTRPPDEFIIINDGSTDDTAGIVRRYGSKIKYMERSNGGKPSALNLALPSVESTYTWIFDDDDVALPDALEAHLNFLLEHPDCDFTYSTNYTFSGEFSKAALKHAKLRRIPFADDADYFLRLIESPVLMNLIPGMLIPTRCYRAVGGFNERMLRSEDWDVVLRIARRFRAGFLDQPTFAERVHNGPRGPVWERHAEADRYKIWKQYDRRIFQALRAQAGLHEYLPARTRRPAEGRALSATEMRRALLRRAMVMAVHGLFTEATEDFRGYVNKLGSTASEFSKAERRQVSMLTYVQNAETVPPPGYYRVLGDLIRGKRELLWAAIRGLYWSVVRDVRRRRIVRASHLAGLGIKLVWAYTGIPAASRRQRHFRDSK